MSMEVRLILFVIKVRKGCARESGEATASGKSGAK